MTFRLTSQPSANSPKVTPRRRVTFLAAVARSRGGLGVDGDHELLLTRAIGSLTACRDALARVKSV